MESPPESVLVEAAVWRFAQNNTSESIREMVPLEDLIVGIAYIVWPLIMIPQYYIITYILLRDNDLCSSSSYRLMFHLGIFDCVQLTGHLLNGFLIVFPQLVEEYVQMLSVIGAGINAAWTGILWTQFFLSLQRFCIMRNLAGMHKFDVVWKIASVFTYLFVIIFWVFSFTGSGFTFGEYCWYYDFEKPWSANQMEIEFYFSMPLVFGTLIIYAGVVLTLCSSRSTQAQAQAKYSQEKKIMAQAIILFGNDFVLINLWHHLGSFVPTSKWTNLGVSFYWILCCGLSPFLYLTMNKTIRDKFLQVFGKKASNAFKKRNSTITVNVSSQAR